MDQINLKPVTPCLRSVYYRRTFYSGFTQSIGWTVHVLFRF